MNKEISVQYAYKKDGKGERHGDQAERMLAAEAKKHMAQPALQALPAQLFASGTPSAPASMLEADASQIASQGLPVNNILMSGRSGPPSANYQNAPLLSSQQPPRHLPQPHPLPAAPSGLPARPPPSQAGYGGPQGFLPPGFSMPQPPGFVNAGGHAGLPLGFHGAPIGRSN